MRRDFERWLNEVELPDECARKTFGLNGSSVEANAELVAQAQQAVRDRGAVRGRDGSPYVDALSALKGIEVGSAFLEVAEFGDFEGFGFGRKVSCWLGTTPKNNSSGEKGVARWHHQRWQLAAAVHACRDNANMAGRTARRKALTKGQIVSPEAKHIEDRANMRLMERYCHLTDDGDMRECKARIVIVSEQIRWTWMIGRTVQAELENAEQTSDGSGRFRRPGAYMRQLSNLDVPAFKTSGYSRSPRARQ